MSLFTEADNFGEVGVVDVGVDSEEPLENVLYNGLEGFWEWHSYQMRKLTVPTLEGKVDSSSSWF